MKISLTLNTSRGGIRFPKNVVVTEDKATRFQYVLAEQPASEFGHFLVTANGITSAIPLSHVVGFSVEDDNG